MPHIIVEYTDNISAEADVAALLPKLNRVLIEQGGAFPIGGIRSRAIELSDYCVADGAEDDAFVHVTVKIAGGRPEEVKKKAFDELFEVVKAHFASLYEKRSLALSMETWEYTSASYKHNNIHARYRKA